MEHNKENNTFTLTEGELKGMIETGEMAEEYLTDINGIRDNIMLLLKVFNLTDDSGKNIRQTIIDKKEKPTKLFIKGGLSTFKLMMAAQWSAESEKELNETFAFLDNLTPYLVKYGNAGPIQKLIEEKNEAKQIGGPK